VWEVVEHFAESGDECEELCGALESQHVFIYDDGEAIYLENGFLGVLCPVRILAERVDLDERLRTELDKGFVQLWMKDVDQEVV
jgi:hypothetical protein